MSSSKLSSSRRIVAVLLPITALSLTACGSLPFGSKDASPTAETSTTASSPTHTPTPTPSESAPATASATEMASATASEDPSASASAEATTNGLTPENSKGRELRLSDFQEIELRLANKFQKVTFTAGQANDAKSSDLIMRVAIFADSKEIETVDVPFNDAHAFEVKAANVNALKITLTPLDQKQEVPVYTQSTTGVIFNVKAE